MTRFRMLVVTCLLLGITALAGCSSPTSATESAINTDSAPKAIGPYSQGIALGSTVYASGQIGIDPATGDLSQGGIEAQTKQAIENAQAILQAGGSGLDKAVKVTVFITNMDDFGVVNDVYAQYFSEPYPARSCVEVASLPKGALVEIEIIAATNA